MKNFLIISVLLIGMYGFSQSREKKTIELAPIIGFAGSTYYGDSVFSFLPLPSANFGVIGDYYFIDRWSLRSGLFYQTMGTEFTYEFIYFPNQIYSDGESHFEEKLNYLTLPVNANWHFGKSKRWNLNFGPSIGFLLSAMDNRGNDVTEGINSMQFGFNFGIGYKIEVSEKFSVLIDYQQMLGLSDIFESPYSNVKNYYGSLNVGGVFKL